MKPENRQMTMWRAFSTGREGIGMLKELEPIIDGIAMDSEYQRRCIEYLKKGNKKKQEKYAVKRREEGKSQKLGGGRRGYDIVFIIRLVLAQCILRKDYREMRALLSDSKGMREFLEIEGEAEERLPCFQQIGEWVKALPEEFFEEMNHRLVMREAGEKMGMKLEKWRSDASVVESNIHYPTDSGLLRDGLRWIHRWIGRMRKELGIRSRMDTKGLTYESGHRIYLDIVKYKGWGKKNQKYRKRAYRKLMKRTEQMIEHFERHIEKGKGAGLFCGIGLSEIEMVTGYAKYAQMIAEWERLKPLMQRSIEQAKRRVLKGEKIANEDKLLSLWEEHSSVIVRGKAGKPCEFGHKVTFWESEEGMMVCGDIYEKGNPSESRVLEQEIEKLSRKGFVFHALSLDRGYWDEMTIDQIMNDNGTLVIYCPKKGKKDANRAAYERTGAFQKMQRFRVGIEGSLSVLVRRHLLRRSRLKKWEGFKRHVHMCLIGMNLLRIVDYQKRQEYLAEQEQKQAA